MNEFLGVTGQLCIGITLENFQSANFVSCREPRRPVTNTLELPAPRWGVTQCSIVLHPTVACGARPRIMLGPGDDLRTHRVPLHVEKGSVQFFTIPSGGTPTMSQIRATTGKEPAGTPAVPIPPRMHTNITVNCCASVSSMPKNRARISTVTPSNKAVPFWLALARSAPD